MSRRLAPALALAILLAPATATAVPIAEEVISFTTHDGLVLEGIVSYPKRGSDPFPAMVLIHGSGLHDADVLLDVPEYDFTDGPQRLFRSLARFLSRRGIVVLRYNKRGGSFGHLNDDPDLLMDSTFQDLVRDAENAYRALAAHPLVDPDRMALFGHSEGTMVAPRVARRVRGEKLVVLVGSVASAFETILHFQGVETFQLFFEVAADADGDGAVTLDELDRLDGNSGLGSYWVGNIASLLYTLGTNPDGSVNVVGLNPGLDANRDGRVHIEDELVPELERLHRSTSAAISTGLGGTYAQSLWNAKPTRRLIAKVRTPILLAQGELDIQTPVSETLDLVEVLESKGRDHELLLFPKLGHSLSEPNDFFLEDGGLTVLDNPTLNEMSKSTMRRIAKRVKALLDSDTR